MALNLASLAGKTQTLVIPFMGQEVKVVYDPNVITAESVDKAQSGEDEDFMNFFLKCVKSWDVTNNTKKVPLTSAAVKKIPLPLLRAIFMGVMSDSGDVDAEGKPSSGS